MSKTSGEMGLPPPNGVAVMPTSIPPVAGNLQSPDGASAASSWYCQRLCNAGCQQGPADVSQATGGGHPAIAHVATDGSAAATSSTKASTLASMVAASPVVPHSPLASALANVPAGPAMPSSHACTFAGIEAQARRLLRPQVEEAARLFARGFQLRGLARVGCTDVQRGVDVADEGIDHRLDRRRIAGGQAAASALRAGENCRASGRRACPCSSGRGPGRPAGHPQRVSPARAGSPPPFRPP